MARHRILLAGLFHETNTFAAGRMGGEDFEILRGEEIFTVKGDASPMGAFLEEAERHDWEIVPLIDARAMPGPSPDFEWVCAYIEELVGRAIAAGPADAIFLVLHGAMASERFSDVEGELLQRLHGQPELRRRPIFGVLDLHANFTERMARCSTALLAYRENPHTDAAETAIRAARLMADALERGLRLRTAYVPTSVIWPPPGTGTANEPMRTLATLARSLEGASIPAANVFAGFAHADIRETGVSFSLVYDEDRVAHTEARELGLNLARAAEGLREKGLAEELELGAALDTALAARAFPACLVEPADNIGGGAPGDGTAILRALLERKIAGSAVVINDPMSAAFLQGREPGGIYDLRIGGRGFPGDPGPTAVRGRLIRVTDGEFILEDRHSHAASMGGLRVSMGPCAVVESEGVTILLTSQRTPPFDLGQWRSQGLEPANFTLIGIKAAVAHRQAYRQIGKAEYFVKTPGPCASDLRTLPYRQIRRPVFPLDS